MRTKHTATAAAADNDDNDARSDATNDDEH